jgi:uncharacterized protein (TIGR00251 family)
MIDVDHGDNSMTFSVRAQPGARKNGVAGEHQGAVKILVTAPAERGRANDAVLAILADFLDVPASRLEIIRGQTHRQKVVRLSGKGIEEARQRLESLGRETRHDAI